MTDETNTNGAAGAPGTDGAAQGDQGPIVRILTQYVKDISFENPNAPAALAANQKQPEIQVNVDVQVKDMSNSRYECAIQIAATAKRDDMVLFIVEVSYAGLFHLENVPVESLQPIMLIEAPRILFPFARRFIADLTRDGGYQPLMLDPIDFHAIYRQSMAQHQAQAASAAPTAAS